MDAENVAAPVDLENGGGDAITIETWPCPADRRLKEKQPFTWLDTAPFVAVVLVGAVLFAAGLLVAKSGPESKQPQGYDVGTVLLWSGVVLALLGIFAAAIAADEGCFQCNLPQFGPD